MVPWLTVTLAPTAGVVPGGLKFPFEKRTIFTEPASITNPSPPFQFCWAGGHESETVFKTPMFIARPHKPMRIRITRRNCENDFQAMDLGRRSHRGRRSVSSRK